SVAELARGDAPLDAVDRRERGEGPAEPTRRDGALERGTRVEPQVAIRWRRKAREKYSVLAKHGELRSGHPPDLAIEPLELRRPDADAHHSGEAALGGRPAPADGEERIGSHARVARNQVAADVVPGISFDLCPKIVAVRGAQFARHRVEQARHERMAAAIE